MMPASKHKVFALNWRSIVAALALASATSLPAQAGDLEAGRDLAEEMCGSCHAVGADSESANAEAPPFREIAGRYSVWNLQEALAEGIMVGHEDMPQFTLSPDQIDALLSYMDTLAPERTAR